MGHDWPGNVRELFGKLDTIVAFAGNHSRLSVDHVLTNLSLHQEETAKRKNPFPVDNSLSAERPVSYQPQISEKLVDNL